MEIGPKTKTLKNASPTPIYASRNYANTQLGGAKSTEQSKAGHDKDGQKKKVYKLTNVNSDWQDEGVTVDLLTQQSVTEVHLAGRWYEWRTLTV